MNVESVGAQFDIGQLDAVAAKALVLEVGDELTATILDLFDNRALIDLGQGQRVAATVTADRPLTTGQTVDLVVTQTTPDQITLSLSPASVAAPTPSISSSQTLLTLGLPDDALNREAVQSLVAQGEPISPEAILDFRAAAISLQATSPEDLRALAFLIANDLPLTASSLSVARQGLVVSPSLSDLAAGVRQQAGQLLAELGPQAEQLQPLAVQLGQLLAAVDPWSASRPEAPGLRVILGQFMTTVEHELQSLAHDAATGLAEERQSSSQSLAATGPEAPQESAAPVAHDQSDVSLAPQRSIDGESQPAGIDTARLAAATGRAAEAATEKSSATTPTAPALGEGMDELHGSSGNMLARAAVEGGAPAGSGVVGSVELRNVSAQQPVVTVPDQAATAEGNPAPALAAQSMPFAGSHSPEGALRGQPGVLAGVRPASEGLSGSLQSAAGPQITARLVVASLDRALASHALTPPASATVAALRSTLQEFVQSVQFHQLQNALPQPVPMSSPAYLSFPLPVPGSPGFESRLYVSYRQDEKGVRRVDSDDLHIVIALELRRLRHIIVSLHVARKRLACQIETESLDVERLLSARVVELQQNLQQLGFAVDPIRCSVVADVRSSALSSVPHALDAFASSGKFARVNVKV